MGGQFFCNEVMLKSRIDDVSRSARRAPLNRDDFDDLFDSTKTKIDYLPNELINTTEYHNSEVSKILRKRERPNDRPSQIKTAMVEFLRGITLCH